MATVPHRKFTCGLYVKRSNASPTPYNRFELDGIYAALTHSLCLDLGTMNCASAQAKNFELGGARPAKLVTPFGYSESKSCLLLVFLHGVRSSADTVTWTDCTGDSRVGLWKVKGSNHVPSFFGTGVIEKASEFVRCPCRGAARPSTPTVLS